MSCCWFFIFWCSHPFNFLSSELIDIAYFITCSLFIVVFSRFLSFSFDFTSPFNASFLVVLLFFLLLASALLFLFQRHSFNHCSEKYPKWVIIKHIYYTSNKRKSLLYLYLSFAPNKHNTRPHGLTLIHKCEMYLYCFFNELFSVSIAHVAFASSLSLFFLVQAKYEPKSISKSHAT